MESRVESENEDLLKIEIKEEIPDTEDYSEQIRLDRQDADYVDVIHTHGLVEDSFEFFTYGTLQAMGDADFYPNFGHRFTLSSLL